MKKSISKKYSKEFEIFVYSGSLAIETVLINENIQEGDFVLIPNNVCYRVLTAILKVGATPLIVKPENELILTTKDFKTVLEKFKVKAILAIHQFGLKVNVKELRELCKNNEIIIEDIAQGWDIKSNTKLGVDSDYIVTSMGKGKPLNFGLGGIILTNNDLYKNMDYNNIESRYRNTSKLISYTLPSNIIIDINNIINNADERKKLNVEYARICIENLNNKKIKIYKTFDIEDCYWERVPLWTENIGVYNRLIKIADELNIQYETSHEKLLEELPLLKGKKFEFFNLCNKKRYFIFLKTEVLDRKKLKMYIEEINKI